MSEIVTLTPKVSKPFYNFTADAPAETSSMPESVEPALGFLVVVIFGMSAILSLVGGLLWALSAI